MIQIKDLIKVYKTGELEVLALRGATLEVSEGEIVAIMGPSGCGKTTLLNIIGGLDRPTAGKIISNGIELSNLSDEGIVQYRKENVGFVFQFFNLVPWLSVIENVELPQLISGKPKHKIRKGTNELLKQVGLLDRAQHKPSELSGGEQQRTAIATALANDPPIILADEPTGELDTRSGSEILKLFKSLRDDYGKTEIIVTHDKRVGFIADRVLAIEDGKIIAELEKDTTPRMEPLELEKEVTELRWKLNKTRKLAQDILTT